MSLSNDILKAQHMGVRDYKKNLSSKLLDGLVVITDHGKPVSINMPYNEILEIIDIVDEMNDQETIQMVLEGREAVKNKARVVDVKEVFSKLK